jgi:hypothetical protein
MAGRLFPALDTNSQHRQYVIRSPFNPWFPLTVTARARHRAPQLPPPLLHADQSPPGGQVQLPTKPGRRVPSVIATVTVHPQAHATERPERTVTGHPDRGPVQNHLPMAEQDGRAGAHSAPGGSRTEAPDARRAGRARARHPAQGRARARARRGAAAGAGAARARGVHVPAGAGGEPAEGARREEPADERQKGGGPVLEAVLQGRTEV